MAEQERKVWVTFFKEWGIYFTLLAGLIAGGYALFCLREPMPTFVWGAHGAKVAGPVAGFFLWLGLLHILYARKSKEDQKLLKKINLVDGERACVSGKVHPTGPLLTAPFSGKDCVGYYYKASHTSGGTTTSSRVTDYEGYALTPFDIRSPLGNAMPVPEPSKEFFERLPQERLPLKNERPAEYLKTADFGEKDTSHLLATGKRKEEINGPCDFCCDRSTGDPPRDPRKCQFEEKIIESEQEVYAIGVYSAEKQGLLPDPDFINRPFVIEAGDAEALAGKTRHGYGVVIFCGFIALAVGAYYFLVHVPMYG